jgi:hypothetical protein
MSGFSAGAIVINRAKHAAIFENGTQARHTAIGANRGSMPPGMCSSRLSFGSVARCTSS